MAGQDSASDKTEDATPRRRQQEREKGQVAKSRDLGAAGILLAAALLLRYMGGMVANMLIRFTETLVGEGGALSTILPPTRQEFMPLALNWLLELMLCGALLLLAILLVAAVANYAQVGALFASKALEPNFNKLNPVTGFTRMFSMRSFVTLAMNIAKIVIIGAVAWPTIEDAVNRTPGMMDVDMEGLFAYLGDTVTWLAIKLAAVLLILGLADYGYQRFQREKDMRMTKQEVKEEYKDTEGSPEMKQKRRQRQREMAQQRMMSNVPQSDVVIRNPTHFAVALRYDIDKDAAPIVVAKGADHLALRIIDVAKEAGVPVWSEPATARALYRQVEVDQPIPQELYAAVIEILIKIYRNAPNPPAWMRAWDEERNNALQPAQA